MAWLLPEHRYTCPGCGYSERILALRDADAAYHLSCGWCGRLSRPVEARDAFFGIWGGEAALRAGEGSALFLEGLRHRWRGVDSIYSPVIVRWSTEEVEVLAA